MKLFAKHSAWILSILGLGTFLLLASGYANFRTSTLQANGIRLSDSRPEVMYRLGVPTYVLDDDASTDKWMLMYQVDGTDPVNRMPEGTKVEDYREWEYDEAPDRSTPRFQVTFDEQGNVEALTWISTDYGASWGPVARVRSGDSEEKLRSLGVPTKESIDGVSKRMEFADLGLAFTLTKGRVYMVEIRRHESNFFSTARRYVRSLL
jgi:hypothetical protein